MYDDACLSITTWIDQLKAGEADAAQRLWESYARRLQEAARAHLGRKHRRVSDEEDLALSVFATLCRGLENGRFDQLQNRDELWWLLLTMTKRKAISQVRRNKAQKHGGGRVFAETDLPGDSGPFQFQNLISDEPTPEFLVQLAEQHQHLMDLLGDEKQRIVALRRIEGYSVEEIATELNVTARTVTRKLTLIRDKWEKELRRSPV